MDWRRRLRAKVGIEAASGGASGDAELNLMFNDIFRRLRTSAPEDSFSGSASPEAIAAAEAELGIKFPDSYKRFLSELGSAYWPEEIAGIGESLPPDLIVVRLTMDERHRLLPHIPNYLIPFSADGWGNHYCLDTSRMLDGECPVVFWNHERGEDQVAVVTHPNFPEWLDKCIDLVIEIDAEE